MAVLAEPRKYVKVPSTSLSAKNLAKRVKRKAMKMMTPEKWDRWKRIGVAK